MLMASTVGIGLGVSSLAIYSAGLFVHDLGNDIGLTTAMFGLAFSLLAFGTALAIPVVGYAIDKFGVKKPTIVGALGLAVGFFAMGTVVHTVPAYLATMGLIGFFGASSGPIAFARAVSSWFDQARGLALGIAMMGMGLGGAIIPITIGRVIDIYGWQNGYLVLAAMAALGILPTLLFVSEAPPPKNESLVDSVLIEDKKSFIPLRGNILFWQLVVTYGVLAVAFTGLIPHFVPMLRDSGMSAADAASIFSLVGISVIVSRLAIGFLLDIIEPTRLAAFLCILCAIGVAALSVGGVVYAPVAAISTGFMLGAELDILGYIISRYFGLAAFGRAYAGPFTAFLIGGGLAPIWVGTVAEQAGSYTPALTIITALTLLCGVGFLFLPSARKTKTQLPGGNCVKPGTSPKASCESDL
ncbi:MFS transporter [Aestuariicella hydrocarbonica]|uniref:MFS transporter n=2 Tax=Pseudomaricurvus hydrocarbonicus TaxID=1470433 RepID=A0A9E5MKD7_9GAMM|nr:MFS transporter [Aestuariicella hydrocarbonica]